MRGKGESPRRTPEFLIIFPPIGLSLFLKTQAGCYIFIIRGFGVELFQFRASALAVAQLLIDTGTFIAEGMQECTPWWLIM